MNTGRNNGVALIVVMCFIITLIALATVASRSVGTQMNVTRKQVDIEKAFYMAETGAEHGMDYVANRGELPKALSSTFGNGRCYITIATKATAGDNSGPSINGIVHLGPGGSGLIALNTGSSTISADTLNQSFGGYVGPAKSVTLNISGSGSQTGLVIDGNVYPLEAGKQYIITSDTMQVALFNDDITQNNKAVGRWHICIAATDATVTE